MFHMHGVKVIHKTRVQHIDDKVNNVWSKYDFLYADLWFPSYISNVPNNNSYMWYNIYRKEEAMLKGG